MTAEAPTFTIVAAGARSSGRTVLIHRLVKGTFHGSLPATIAVEMHACAFHHDGADSRLQLFDLSGQERFIPLAGMYLPKADAVLLAFDTACPDLAYIEAFHAFLTETAPALPVYLVGTKTDQARCVAGVRAVEEWAASQGYPVLFCCSRTGENVGGVFGRIVADLRAKREERAPKHRGGWRSWGRKK